jgi:hypothetical protein
MEIKIDVISDIYNTNAVDKLIITPFEDEIYLKLSDSDREISVRTKDISAVLKLAEINKD